MLRLYEHSLYERCRLAVQLANGLTNLQEYRLGLDPRNRAIPDTANRLQLRILTPLE